MFKCIPKEEFDSHGPVTLFVLHTCLDLRELGIDCIGMKGQLKLVLSLP